ncbi:DUF4919 domain-containing protein [Limibacter armeniacum]|uniref:DUF4919 domain-containing protein n=1 Tax=Limibacter armeniacum TaxID=466084 RepID=UPI002FE560F5
MKQLTSLLFLLLFNSMSLFSQYEAPEFAAALDLYERQQYSEAIPHLAKYIAKDQSNAEAYKIRGNCYWELNKPDSAQSDYLSALNIDSNFSDVHFNLSGIYEIGAQYDRALKHLRTYTVLEPEDPNGYARIGVIQHMLNNNDSALYYLDKAHNLDMENLMVHYYQAWINYYEQNFEEAIEWANNGKALDPLNSDLYLITGLAHFRNGTFEASAREFDQSYKLTDDIGNLVLRAKSEVFASTDSALLVHIEMSEYRFKHINTDALASLTRNAADVSNKYHYSKLIERFEEKECDFGLDEYFMLYLGFSMQGEYAPYGLEHKELYKLFEKEQYDQVIELGQTMLEKAPFNGIRIYEMLAIAYLHQENEEAFYSYIKKYQGIVNAILATGEGSSFENAFIVTSPGDEYDILKMLGYSSTSQSLHFKDGHSYDLLEAKDQFGDSRKFYFNIDQPYSSLANQWGLEKGKKEKRNKRKKD